MNNNLQAFILAAGKGSRLNTGRTKLIEPICGQPMIMYPLKLLQSLNIHTTLILGYQKELVLNSIDHQKFADLPIAEQLEQRGTGHALLCAQSHWKEDHLLVLNGDMPLITPDIINDLICQHRQQQAAISFVIAHNINPHAQYGRIVRHNETIKIIEKKHFEANINEYSYINAGIYIINRSFLERYLNSINYNSQTNELYITDLIEKASDHKLRITTLEVPYDAIRGVNTLRELAEVEALKSQEIIDFWMNQGVRFIAPHTIYMQSDVTIGKGSIIHPGVQLLGTTSVGVWCTINAHAVLNNAHVEDNSIVPPHAHIIAKPQTYNNDHCSFFLDEV